MPTDAPPDPGCTHEEGHGEEDGLSTFALETRADHLSASTLFRPPRAQSAYVGASSLRRPAQHAEVLRPRTAIADRAELLEAVREGAGERVRPVLMTAVAVIAGLLPITWGGGTGSTVMKPLAAPMVGGMVSATVLTLVVVPALYALWREAQLRKVWAEEAAPEDGAADPGLAPAVW